MDPDSVSAVERVPHGGSDDPSLLDFSANVNPERPPGASEVYEAALADATRYPDDRYESFRTAAADSLDCGPRSTPDPSAVVPTAGGLAAIRLALDVTVGPGDRVCVPAPSFGEYAREVRLQGATPSFVAHDAVLDTDPGDYAAVVVCTPNNPTGDALDPDALRDYADACHDAGTTLLADEAFLDFTPLPSLAGHPGAVVARSLTKMYGLPGLRAGFAVATGEKGRRLETARPTWALSTPAAAVGAHSLRQDAFVAETRERVDRERDRIAASLPDGFDARPSVAPFLLLSVEGSVDRVLATARDRGVVLRDARTFRGLDSHVRVAVKRPDENDRLLDALEAV